jgi:hypothetical protein
MFLYVMVRKFVFLPMVVNEAILTWVMMSIARNMFASHPKTWDVFKMPSLNQRF